MSDVLVIIPAYNEASRIAGVLKAIRDLSNDWDALVVNDGSSDQTAEAAAESGAVVISHPFNLGYGAALQTGYKYAFAQGYAYAVQMDADGQHMPEEAMKLLHPVQTGEADVVIGSRFLQGGGGYQIPALRRAGIRLFGALTWCLSGQWLTDVTSGFSAVNRKVMRLFAGDLFPADFPDADVRLMLLKLGLRVREIPAAMRSGPPEKSMHGGLIAVWYVIKMALSMFIVWFTRFNISIDKENSP